VCDIEGHMKYYVHYKGWNSRYDEWIDVTRIAFKKKEPEPGPEDNEANFSKSSPTSPEVCKSFKTIEYKIFNFSIDFRIMYVFLFFIFQFLIFVSCITF